MEYTIRGKNVEVSESLKQHVSRKLGKIEKYFDAPLHATVTLSIEKERYIVEVTVPLDGMLLRGEEETDSLFSSLDRVVDKLERQVQKYKTRIMRRLRQADRGQESAYPAGVDDGEVRVVRTKRFALKPMSVEEAIMQMNMVGHDFFVFTNGDTERVNVVYRRRDGDYGLIEPEG